MEDEKRVKIPGSGLEVALWLDWTDCSLADGFDVYGTERDAAAFVLWRDEQRRRGNPLVGQAPPLEKL